MEREKNNKIIVIRLNIINVAKKKKKSLKWD